MTKGIFHDFIVVSRDFIIENTGKLPCIDTIVGDERIKIHDDVISYIGLTLKYVECYNYKNEKKQYGLYYEGISYIYGKSLEIFALVIQNWLQIIKIAPDQIVINDKGETFQKKMMESDLQKLFELIQKALVNKAAIMHLGI